MKTLNNKLFRDNICLVKWVNRDGTENEVLMGCDKALELHTTLTEDKDCVSAITERFTNANRKSGHN